MVHNAYSDMPAPLLCTHTSAKFPREARHATSPSSSTTTRRPRRASPQATAMPTSPPPTTAKSYSGEGLTTTLAMPDHYRSALRITSCNRAAGEPPHPAPAAPTSQPKSDISDLGQLYVPNSGKPEFGRGEVNRVCGTV